VTRDEWLADFSDRLGVAAPDDVLVETLLALAGTAAHNSERTAARWRAISWVWREPTR
jgi:hypothetical protein